MTPNQVVGYNLWCARRERGWTQAQAPEALEPHLGVRWTVAQVSAAERSMDGTRIRQFTADDIVAFAHAFGLPITYFFVPPKPHALWTKIEPSTSDTALNRTMAVMIDLILGDPNDGAPQVARHLHDVMQGLDPALYSDAQRRILELARVRMLGVIRAALGSIGGWQRSLRSLADELGALERDVAKQMASSLPEVREEDFVALLADEAKTDHG